jgi:hypothetical protein
MIDILSNSYPFAVNLLQILVIAHTAAMVVSLREMKWTADIALRAKFPELAEEGMM